MTEEEKKEEEVIEEKEVEDDKGALEQAEFESLSPEEREMVQSGEGKIVDGEFKVSLKAFRKRLGRETAKVRSEQERSAALEAAIQAVRETRETKKEDEFDDGYTDEQLDEMVAQGDLRRPAQIIAARTFRELRKKEREIETNSFKENAWRSQVAAGDGRALQRFPQLNPKGEEFDKEFYEETIKTAAKNGYLYQENGRWVYLNPEAMSLAADEVKHENPKYKEKMDNKTSTDALNEKLREARLKKSEIDKGKGGGEEDKKPGLKPTKADYETAKKFNIPVESLMKYKKKNEAVV
jgi:hypothetical protein